MLELEEQIENASYWEKAKFNWVLIKLNLTLLCIHLFVHCMDKANEHAHATNFLFFVVCLFFFALMASMGV